MSTKILKKVCFKKCNEKSFFSAHLGAETFMKNKGENSSKKTWLKHVTFLQKWPFLAKFDMLESGLFDEFSTFFWEREIEFRCIQFKQGINCRFLEYQKFPLLERGKLNSGVYSSNRELTVDFWSTKIPPFLGAVSYAHPTLPTKLEV